MKRHIPNLLTFGNLMCGFLSIGYATNGDSKTAIILIFIALMLDAMDGRVARILGVPDDGIGKSLDSLADIVSFGVAPAFLVTYSYFEGFGTYSLLLAGLFPLFGSYRLARFNVTSQAESLKYFKGLPITIAGGIVAFLVFFENIIPIWMFIIIYYGLAVFMVSTLKIPSFKSVRITMNGLIFALFLIYTAYILMDVDSKEFPIIYYVAVGTYIGFLLLRRFKEKERKIFRKKNKFGKLKKQ